MMFFKYYLIVILSAFFITQTEVLAEASPAQEFAYARRINYRFTALSHDLFEGLYESTHEVKDHAALLALGQVVIKVDEYLQDFQLVEAYTLKPDGKKIHITQDQVITSHLPESFNQSNIFEGDTKARTLLFPNLSIGDRTYMSFKIRMKRNPLPGGFLISESFTSDASKAHIKLSLEAPESLKIHKDIQGFSETKTSRKGRTLYTWVRQPHVRRKESHTLYANTPSARPFHIMISSYPDHATTERAFFENAELKSQPTPTLHSLADKITHTISDRRAQAEAIYDWITRNIRYVSIALGEKGWVPREAETILSTKYGDCKDYTTLMRALLAAKGISSEYVLINSASEDYAMPSIPGALQSDHVMLYLPEFDLYTDPTTQSLAFHYLPLAYYGKPVIRSNHKGEIIVTKIPLIKQGMNHLTVITNITFRADGTPYGTSTLKAKGPASGDLRSVVALKDFPQPSQGFTWYGDASIKENDPIDHKEPYSAEISFNLTNKFFGAFPNMYSIPTMQPIDFDPLNAPLEALLNQKTENFMCSPGTYKVLLNITLPKGITLKNLPPERTVQTALASYKTRHTIKGRTVHIERHFESKAQGPVCTAEAGKALEPVLHALNYDTLSPPSFEKARP